jgi:hypothetical protein
MGEFFFGTTLGEVSGRRNYPEGISEISRWSRSAPPDIDAHIDLIPKGLKQGEWAKGILRM